MKLTIFFKNGKEVSTTIKSTTEFDELIKEMRNWRDGFTFKNKIWIRKEEISHFQLSDDRKK